MASHTNPDKKNVYPSSAADGDKYSGIPVDDEAAPRWRSTASLIESPDIPHVLHFEYLSPASSWKYDNIGSNETSVLVQRKKYLASSQKSLTNCGKPHKWKVPAWPRRDSIHKDYQRDTRSSIPNMQSKRRGNRIIHWKVWVRRNWIDPAVSPEIPWQYPIQLELKHSPVLD